MSSDEVKDIMQMYSVSIDNWQQEIEYFSNKVASLNKVKSRLQTHNKDLENEQQEIAKQITENTSQLLLNGDRASVCTITDNYNDTLEKYSEVGNLVDIYRSQTRTTLTVRHRWSKPSKVAAKNGTSATKANANKSQ